MTKTKNIVLECNSAEELEQALNKVNEEENVFATQTHIKVYNTIGDDGKEFQAILYVAVLFVRCE